MIDSQLARSLVNAACDQEPIHIPGSIQPHGILLAVRPDDLTVVQLGGDTRSLLGIDPHIVRGTSLRTLLGESALARMDGLFARPPVSSRPWFAFQLHTSAGTLDVAAHASDGLLVVELESSHSPAAGEAVDVVHGMAARIGNAESVQELLERIVDEVQRATGFDRVMVYRFDESGDGHVVAERRRDDATDSLLGLRYPASDIPQQARALYLSNWIRCIPDARYSPAPIWPVENPLTDRPLDLTFSSLRSVSPVHLEYLANMGVRASLSLSLVVRGRLWGLIACHHQAPLRPSCSLRSGLELFAQLASLQLTTCLDLEYAQRDAARRDIHHRVVKALAQQPFPEGLLDKLDELVQLVSASGIVVHANGESACAGCIPSAGAIARLLSWLDSQPHLGLWHTDRLAEHVSSDANDAALAAGLLAIALPNAPRCYVLWFRPELATTVTWAGDPRKAVVQSAARLSPRTSFAAWRETVRGRSQAWSADEVEAANSLRAELLEMELLRLQAAARQRETLSKRQHLVMAELDHRVKNVLATIQSLVRFSGKSAESLAGFVKAIELRLISMARAHDLLTSSRWTGASLQQLVRDELAPFRPTETVGVRIEGEDFLLQPSAALALSLVFHELATNAAKYGALSTPHGSVVVTCTRVTRESEPPSVRVEWLERNGPAVAQPTRSGFGRVLLEKIFAGEASGAQVSLCFEPAGVRCTIVLAAERLVLEESSAAPRATELAPPVAPARLNGIKVLVVEDNPIVSLDLVDSISAAAAHVVGPFQTLAESTEAAARAPFDIALLDIDVNGEAVWPIATIVRARKIPILFTTGFSDVTHWPEEFRDSATVRKPYDLDRLLHELGRSVRGVSKT